MFFKFFDWLKKKYGCENKKDFEKVEMDNTGSVNINANANMKTSSEIVKDLTDNDSVAKNNIAKESRIKDNLTKDLLNAR